VVRTAGEPAALAPAVRTLIHELDPLRSVYEVSALDRRIDDAFAQDRLRTTLLTAFAASALALVCVGTYGTLSYGVTRRRQEVGLRLALGATRAGIVRQFLLQALRVLGAASAIGLLLTFAVTRLVAGMLYGVSPTDPVVLVAVVALVLSVGALAALVPSVRASRVEPLSTLREG
jgi:putative ABC transport system permease protein